MTAPIAPVTGAGSGPGRGLAGRTVPTPAETRALSGASGDRVPVQPTDAGDPLGRNIPFLTAMAAAMPLPGRG